MHNYQPLNMNITIIRPEFNLFLNHDHINMHNDECAINILFLDSVNNIVDYDNGCFFFQRDKCYIANNKYKVKIVIKDKPEIIIDLFNMKNFVVLKNKKFFTNIIKKIEKRINSVIKFIEEKNNKLNLIFMEVLTIYGTINSTSLRNLYKLFELFDMERLKNIESIEDLRKEVEPYKLINPDDAIYIIRDETCRYIKYTMILGKDSFDKISVSFVYDPYGTTISTNYYYFIYFLKNGKDIITKYINEKVVNL